MTIHYAGLNFVDLLYSRGAHQNNRALVRPPFTLGLEFAGTVAAAPASSRFRAGDAVFGSGLGAFAEQMAVPEAALTHLPERWTLRDAAGLAATAPVSYGALVHVAKVQAGETVLVLAAAGGLGVMAVQIARARGARVIGAVGSAAKRRVLRDLGVEDVVDYSVAGWEGKVLEATGGLGVDVTFDSVGMVEQSIRCSNYGARILVVGFAGREGNLEKIAANRILLKGIAVIGYRFGESGRRRPDETAAIWEGVRDLIRRGLLKPVVYNGDFKGLESVPRAMEAMAAREVWGKAIIQVIPPSNIEKANL